MKLLDSQKKQGESIFLKTHNEYWILAEKLTILPYHTFHNRYKTKNMTNEIIYKFAKVSYDQDNPEITGGKHIQLFLEELENEDPVTQLPEEFIMVSRVSIILRGLAHHLQQSRSAAQLWKPIAEEVLARES